VSNKKEAERAERARRERLTWYEEHVAFGVAAGWLPSQRRQEEALQRLLGLSEEEHDGLFEFYGDVLDAIQASEAHAAFLKKVKV